MSDSSHPLVTDKLTMHFGGLAALEDIDLVVRTGRDPRHYWTQRRRQEHVLQLPDRACCARPAGGCCLEGNDVTGLPPERISQLGVARSYQITNIFPGSTCLENIRIAVQSRQTASRCSCATTERRRRHPGAARWTSSGP